MADGVFKDIHAKEGYIRNVFTPGSLRGDETAGDINFSGSNATVSRIVIGRQSGISGNQTNFQIRNRIGSAGIFIDPANGMSIGSSNLPDAISGGTVFEINSTKAIWLPFATNSSILANLSGASVRSGALIYNTTSGSLCVYTDRWRELAFQ